MGRNTLNSYAAGLLDGEGCIRWNRSPSVEITNRHLAVLETVRDRFGGSIRVKGPDVFAWSAYGKNALKFLKSVSRYSIIKHPQIVQLVAACATSAPSQRNAHIVMLKRLKHVYTN